MMDMIKFWITKIMVEFGFEIVIAIIIVLAMLIYDYIKNR